MTTDAELLDEDIGPALGLSAGAAQMRVSRALEKLKVRLRRRGITSTAAVLGTALANRAVEAAPAELGIAVAQGALASLPAIITMSTTKTILVSAAIAVAAVGLGWNPKRKGSDSKRSGVRRQIRSIDQKMAGEPRAPRYRELSRFLSDRRQAPRADLHLKIQPRRRTPLPPSLRIALVKAIFCGDFCRIAKPFRNFATRWLAAPYVLRDSYVSEKSEQRAAHP